MNINWIFDDIVCFFLKSTSFYLLELHTKIIYSINDVMHRICFKKMSNEGEGIEGGTDETRLT